jgi:hypothetical protein
VDEFFDGFTNASNAAEGSVWTVTDFFTKPCTAVLDALLFHSQINLFFYIHRVFSSYYEVSIFLHVPHFVRLIGFVTRYNKTIVLFPTSSYVFCEFFTLFITFLLFTQLICSRKILDNIIFCNIYLILNLLIFYVKDMYKSTITK